MATLDKWANADGWQHTVRGYEDAIVHELAAVLAWPDVLQARAECDAVLTSAQQVLDDADKRLPKLTERVDELKAAANRAAEVYNRTVDGHDHRPNDAMRKSEEVGAELRKAAHEHDEVTRARDMAARDVARLAEIARNLARVAKPETPLADRLLTLKDAGSEPKRRRRG